MTNSPPGVAKFSGLFELATPKDLYRKLEHDFARLQTNSLDSFAAFDFFVTAEHMVDWLHPGDEEADKAVRKQKRESNILLRICSHLASGSKHFEATNRRHDVVKGAELHGGDFSDDFSDDFDVGELLIRLDGDAAASLGESVKAANLAEKVLAYWKNELAL